MAPCFGRNFLQMGLASGLPGWSQDAIPALIKKRQEGIIHCCQEYKEGHEKMEAEMGATFPQARNTSTY